MHYTAHLQGDHRPRVSAAPVGSKKQTNSDDVINVTRVSAKKNKQNKRGGGWGNTSIRALTTSLAVRILSFFFFFFFSGALGREVAGLDP